MLVLCACEESQIVTKAFRARGHAAYSCDILPCSGGHPEWHLQQDVIPLLTMLSWDLIIAFPPCTDLAVSGAAHFAKKQADGRQQRSIDFFMVFTKLKCKYAIENPIGIMSRLYRKPDQIVNPFQFGDPVSKKTCLWINGLPLLKPTKIVAPGEKVTFPSGKSMPKWYADAWRLPPDQRAKIRSKTFPGIADAMADQWGHIC